MKIIRPVTVTPAMLTSSVPETAPAAYAGGTTYALGDRASVVTGSAAAVYESLAAANVGHDPASSPDWWREVATTWLAWDGGTTYAEGDRVLDAANHREYVSLQGANTNHPVTDAAWWYPFPSNRWAMFDQVNGTETAARDSLSVSMALTGRIDSIALLNISGASVRIEVAADGAGTIYDQTIGLSSDSGITDWFAYFFEEVIREHNAIRLDLPLFASPTVTVTLSDPGSEVSIGNLVLGMARELGAAQYGAQIGITDFSKKAADDFGNYTIVERPFSRRGRFTVWASGMQIPALLDLIVKYRATPVVWIGAEERTETALFGFYKDFNVEIAYPTMSICTLEIEGLT